MVRPLPKNWLIHDIVYEPYIGKDDWNNPKYDKPIAIKNVRYDDSTVFSRDNTQTKVLADGIIFVDSVNSSPVPDFIEQSRITFDGIDMYIKKVVPCYYPTKNEVHHWELEVV